MNFRNENSPTNKDFKYLYAFVAVLAGLASLAAVWQVFFQEESINIPVVISKPSTSEGSSVGDTIIAVNKFNPKLNISVTLSSVEIPFSILHSNKKDIASLVLEKTRNKQFADDVEKKIQEHISDLISITYKLEIILKNEGKVSANDVYIILPRSQYIDRSQQQNRFIFVPDGEGGVKTIITEENRINLGKLSPEETIYVTAWTPLFSLYIDDWKAETKAGCEGCLVEFEFKSPIQFH